MFSRNENGLPFGKPLMMLARPERFELPTPWFVAKYSIQLSYGREAADYSGIGSAQRFMSGK